MKNLRVYILMLVLMSSALITSANTFHQVVAPMTENFLFDSGATVEEATVALADYSEMSIAYVRENLISFYSNGLDENGDEVGTITVQTEEGPTTWNWRYGSNIMVIWPT